MRIAALFDIHGNVPALEAVLDDVNQAQVDAIVIGGDTIAGPQPRETLALLQQISTPISYIHGNAESELLRILAGEAGGGMSAHADEVAQWVAKQLTPEQAEFIGSWPLTQQFTLPELGGVLFCHATPYNDVDVFTQQTATEKLLPIFNGLDAAVVVCGHTHMQFDRIIANVRVVNAGSVGMPFGKTGAFWLLLDKKITFKQTHYDFSEAATRIRQTEYPHAADFAVNNILQVPSEAVAFEFLTKMELS